MPAVTFVENDSCEEGQVHGVRCHGAKLAASECFRAGLRPYLVELERYAVAEVSRLEDLVATLGKDSDGGQDAVNGVNEKLHEVAVSVGSVNGVLPSPSTACSEGLNMLGGWPGASSGVLEKSWEVKQEFKEANSTLERRGSF